VRWYRPQARGMPMASPFDAFHPAIVEALFGGEGVPLRRFPPHHFEREPGPNGRCTVEVWKPKHERGTWRGRGSVTFDPNPPSEEFRALVNDVRKRNG
jgi:hypothetical protein